MKLKSPNNLASDAAAKFTSEALLDSLKSKVGSLTRKVTSLENELSSRNKIIIEQSRRLSSRNEAIRRQKESLCRKNAIIKKKSTLIKELRTEIDEHITKRVAVFNENQELEEKASKYANKLADACVELRALKEKLANIVVNNVNAQALKSAENALCEKESIIKEKDEVIDDLGKELAHKDKLIAWIREASKGYCDYGVAANDFIKLLSKEYVLLSKREADVNVELLEKCKMYQLYGFPGNYSKSKEE